MSERLVGNKLCLGIELTHITQVNLACRLVRASKLSTSSR
jgi:hypothetical protein